jgi:uncharacterized protein with LGFP repeats
MGTARGAIHKLYKVASDVKGKDENALVTAYAVERPDGQWSVMLVNNDQDNDHSVRMAFADPVAGHERFFSGTVDRVVFGPAEYQWHPDPVPADAVPPSGQAAGATGAGGAPDGDDSAEGGRRRRVSGHASPDGPPSVSTIKAGGPDSLYELPKASIIVLRGKVATY